MTAGPRHTRHFTARTHRRRSPAGSRRVVVVEQRVAGHQGAVADDELRLAVERRGGRAARGRGGGRRSRARDGVAQQDLHGASLAPTGTCGARGQLRGRGACLALGASWRPDRGGDLTRRELLGGATIGLALADRPASADREDDRCQNSDRSPHAAAALRGKNPVTARAEAVETDRRRDAPGGAAARRRSHIRTSGSRRTWSSCVPLRSPSRNDQR